MTLAMKRRLFCEEIYNEDDQFIEQHNWILISTQQSRIPVIKRIEALEEHRLKCLKGWINCDDDFIRLWHHRLETIARYMDGLRMILEINISVSLL